MAQAVLPGNVAVRASAGGPMAGGGPPPVAAESFQGLLRRLHGIRDLLDRLLNSVGGLL